MVLEFVTFVHMVAGRSHVGLTICDCFLIKHNKNPDNVDEFDFGLCSKVSIAARKQNKPRSRDSHLTDLPTTN